jgi:hypothetical protein
VFPVAAGNEGGFSTIEGGFSTNGVPLLTCASSRSWVDSPKTIWRPPAVNIQP